MASRKHYRTIAGRGALVLLLALSFVAQARAEAPGGAAPRAVAKSVSARTEGAATLIRITGTAPLSYSVRRPTERLLIVELPEVDASPLARAYSFRTSLVERVTVRRRDSAGASLEVDLRAPVRDRSRIDGNRLVLELYSAADAAPKVEGTASTPAPSAATKAVAPAADNDGGAAQRSGPAQQPQTSQGAQYGQPGFVGEPISLNVVNADIRDILNYITEQYGVNFVVDSSVQKVPVTINVTDVPWNFALNSILKANRLGIEVTGNILRLATLETLKDEARIRADEESARARLREAELFNVPLVTEIIRLNYARATGTLGQASEGTGNFSGGVTGGGSASDSGGAGGASPASGGIMPIIRRRLSKRGGVEVDARSNTLIVTDVQENIDAIRRLVQILDQPEPQVEIETRIVLANRTFSRDLGVQLGASVFNPSRGGGGSFETFTNTRAGLVPGGLPGGLVNTPPAAPNLGATAASTVIGLTTGIFGTAQIGALITAAEAKGQAKIVATPRVTALNNRPAQIEAGSQIPVVTPQTGTGGGTSVFTTTFVSVPLRLSITPQITDAGTVVLRVVMENNSVNLALTNSLGTPGIDTQRMQTEVLVPDGGTTVVGGVLNDRESENVSRTPGLGSLPVVGNLFRRKAVARNTDEILFFITPRIYRPDYQGQRIETQPSTGTRSVQIPQPVPLGNPETNTPSPTAQPQGQAPIIVVPQPAPDAAAPPAGATTAAPRP
ncbi:MAG TPA: type IV pilus secretin PilQ [Pyrinomonadaceae bacterium]|nr:type IV pilus secretin PilQ [Pyrinomonadaceae bacterium]